MKKKYISPEIIEVVDFGNPLLDIGTTIPVDTGGGGESQSGAEGKRHAGEGGGNALRASFRQLLATLEEKLLTY